MPVLPTLMAVLNFGIALGLILQCLTALNRVSDHWIRVAIHLMIATAGGLIAFRLVDVTADLAFDDRVTVGRFLLNLGMIPAWILIHRVARKG